MAIDPDDLDLPITLITRSGAVWHRYLDNHVHDPNRPEKPRLTATASVPK